MKLRIMRADTGQQALLVTLNERQDGEAYMEFHESDSGADVARKLRELAETIETEAGKGG